MSKFQVEHFLNTFDFGSKVRCHRINLGSAGQNLSFIQGNKITSLYCSKM